MIMKLRQTLAQSFGKVRRDMVSVKISFTDWVIFLKRRNDVLEQKMLALERKVDELEQSKNVVIY